MPGNLEAVKKLFDHPSFSMTNPNSVRALIGAFAGSVVNFHAADGSGYEWFTDQVSARTRLNGAGGVVPSDHRCRCDSPTTGLVSCACFGQMYLTRLKGAVVWLSVAAHCPLKAIDIGHAGVVVMQLTSDAMCRGCLSCSLLPMLYVWVCYHIACFRSFIMYS